MLQTWCRRYKGTDGWPCNDAWDDVNVAASVQSGLSIFCFSAWEFNIAHALFWCPHKYTASIKQKIKTNAAVQQKPFLMILIKYISYGMYIYLHTFKCLTNTTSKWTRLQWNSLFVLFTPLLGYSAGVFQVLCLVALAVFGVVDQPFAPCISVHFFANLFWISWFVSSIGWRISFIYIYIYICVCVYHIDSTGWYELQISCYSMSVILCIFMIVLICLMTCHVDPRFWKTCSKPQLVCRFSIDDVYDFA